MPAKSKHKGLPRKKACMTLEDAGRSIVDLVLAEDDEQAEVGSARAILAALQRLKVSIPNPSPEQEHDFTTIRASADAIIRMHGGPEMPLSREFFKGLDPSAQ